MAHKLARIIWHLVTHRVSYDESIFAQREEDLLRRKRRQLHNLCIHAPLVRRQNAYRYPGFLADLVH